MNLLIRWIIISIVIIASAYAFSGIKVAGFFAALAAAIALGFVNAVIRPLVILLTLPINVLTLGLFTFVINAFLVMLVSGLIPGFSVASFWWALLLSLIISIINNRNQGQVVFASRREWC